MGGGAPTFIRNHSTAEWSRHFPSWSILEELPSSPTLKRRSSSSLWLWDHLAWPTYTTFIDPCALAEIHVPHLRQRNDEQKNVVQFMSVAVVLSVSSREPVVEIFVGRFWSSKEKIMADNVEKIQPKCARTGLIYKSIEEKRKGKILRKRKRRKEHKSVREGWCISKLSLQHMWGAWTNTCNYAEQSGQRRERETKRTYRYTSTCRDIFALLHMCIFFLRESTTSQNMYSLKIVLDPCYM